MTIFSLLGRCHRIYNQLFIDELKITKLGDTHRTCNIGIYGELQGIIPKLIYIYKNALIRRFTVPWARWTGAGFGLLGEREAESTMSDLTPITENLSMYPQQGPQAPLYC